MKKIFYLILTGFTIILPGLLSASSIKDDETLIFFPGNAYLDSGAQIWVIPIRGWVFELEEDSFWRKVTLDSLAKTLEVEPDTASRPIYAKRARMFLVDNERGKEINVELFGKRTKMEVSQPNGHFQGTIFMDRSRLGDAADTTWVSYQAVTPDDDHRVFRGQAQLIAPQGISVISDIDDTIKISNVKDKEALLKNTFLKKFQAVPGMAEAYQAWAQQGAVFHYLSASPWQLYPALEEFISASRFPDGSYNLKNFRVKDENFFNLFTSQVEYKQPIVENLLKQYPGRRFILVGDGGEQDPDIFAEVARKYPQQVLHIFIRDLTPDAVGSDRYRTTFAGIPNDHWTVFNDGETLLNLKIAN